MKKVFSESDLRIVDHCKKKNKTKTVMDDVKHLTPLFSRHINAVTDGPLDADIIETLVEVFLACSSITGDESEDASTIASAIRDVPDVCHAIADADSVGAMIAADARHKMHKIAAKNSDDVGGSVVAWFVGDNALEAGTEVLAMLSEDGEWHAASVVSVAKDEHNSDENAANTEGASETEGRVTVMFHEFGATRTLSRNHVLPMSMDADSTGANDVEGLCEMCGRDTKITDHHLIPRSEHSRFVKRGYKMGFLKGRDNIAEICRPCHSAVHRFASNKDLADRYFTTSKLLEEPQIQRWVAWVATQMPGKYAKHVM